MQKTKRVYCRAQHRAQPGVFRTHPLADLQHPRDDAEARVPPARTHRVRPHQLELVLCVLSHRAVCGSDEEGRESVGADGYVSLQRYARGESPDKSYLRGDEDAQRRQDGGVWSGDLTDPAFVEARWDRVHVVCRCGKGNP